MVHDRCNCYFSFWVIFCTFTSLTAQKVKISKKWKRTYRYHHITHIYQKLWLNDVWILRYGAQRMGRQTEKVTYKGGCPTWKIQLNNSYIIRSYLARWSLLEESTYEILIQLTKIISITPGLQVFTKLISHQHKKLYGPFLWMWSNSLNGSLQKFLVAIWLAWNDEKLSQPWSHPVVLNTGPWIGNPVP